MHNAYSSSIFPAFYLEKMHKILMMIISVIIKIDIENQYNQYMNDGNKY